MGIKKSKQSELCFDLVPLTGIEPVRIIRPTDFKSVVSASSTTATVILAFSFKRLCYYNTQILPCQEIVATKTEFILPIQ